MSADADQGQPRQVKTPTEDDPIQSQRLKQIQSDIEAVFEHAHDLFYTELENPHLSGEMANIALHRTLKLSIIDLKPLMVSVFEDVGTPYWSEYELGELVIAPPPELTESGRSDGRTVREPATAARHTYIGLRSLIETDEQLQARFEARVVERGVGEQTVTETVAAVTPRPVLEEGLGAIRAFASEIGIELEPDDDDGNPIIRGFDQSGDEPHAELDSGDYTGDPDI